MSRKTSSSAALRVLVPAAWTSASSMARTLVCSVTHYRPRRPASEKSQSSNRGCRSLGPQPQHVADGADGVYDVIDLREDDFTLKSSTQLHLIPNSNLLVSGGASGPASSTCSVLDLPVEVVDYVLEDLSVMDLCSVGLTNTFFANILRRSCVWRDVLSDILSIVPMPRLGHALNDMDYCELRRTAIRLATYDRDLGRTPHVWRLLKPPPNVEFCAKFVPGGRHILYSSGFDLMVYDCHSTEILNLVHLLGPFEHGIRDFSVFPCSASEVFIMVADGPPGWRKVVPTRIMVYRCNPVSRTCTVMDDFTVDGQVLATFFDARYVAVQWCHYTPSYQRYYRGYVRDHTRGVGTGTVQFEGMQFERKMSLAIASSTYIIASARCQSAVFRLPPMRDGDAPKKTDPPVSCSALWSFLDRDNDNFALPYIVLPPGDTADYLPAFGIWSGPLLRIFTRSSSKEEYRVLERRFIPAAFCAHELTSPLDASTAIMPAEWEKGWTTAIMTVDFPHMHGLARLEHPDRAKMCDFRALHVPDEVVEKVVSMSYDAESQQLLVVTEKDDNVRQTFLYRLFIVSQ